MFAKVIAGWDGTAESEAAVDWAADHAGDAPLTIVHAIGGKPTGNEYLRATGELSAERVELIDVADRVRARHPELHVETETLHGSALDTLRERLAPDTMVVVGGPTHHRTTSWTLGSRLAGHRGGGAVAVVPAGWSIERGKSVVVGVDGSQASLRAVEIAVAEASRIGLPLEIVHVWQVPGHWDAAMTGYGADVGTLERIHRDLLDQAVGFARELGADPSAHMEAGDAADVLRHFGRNAEMVVVASHSAGILSKFFLGSLSHALLADPPAPVVIVPGGAGPTRRRDENLSIP